MKYPSAAVALTSAEDLKAAIWVNYGCGAHFRQVINIYITMSRQHIFCESFPSNETSL